MIDTVVVDRKVLDGFRRRSTRAYPNEHLEAIWGKIEGATAYIHLLADVEYLANADAVTYEEDALKAEPDERLMAHEGTVLLGSIHSHPQTTATTQDDNEDASPSEHDWRHSYRDGEKLMGIIRIVPTPKKGRYKTKIVFWEPFKPVKITYPRNT